jgi:2-polyprenyl-6-methoxyphenol hydroxylase-like FAD-dependent oxidoreductase
MNQRHPITIIGGGLAGLTLGIALRRCDVPVTVFEAGTYPRHRVCGEFISGNGLEVLSKLGLHQKFLDAGAIVARSASFHSMHRSFGPKPLPRPALCLSRHLMDELLAREFHQLGGRLLERQRVAGASNAPGTVRATGRRINSSGSVKWLGLKAHARSAPLAADLEMHFVPHGYVGLCRLGGTAINVCGLFAIRNPVPRLSARWPDFLRGPEGSILRARLNEAEFAQDTFCTVSGLDLRPGSAHESDECRIGDAWSMIPPVTGNGMSMAFESAAWAAEPLAAYSCGTVSWDNARNAVAQRCSSGFARRLQWASWLQSLLMCRGSRGLLLALAGRLDWLWRSGFDGTR